MTVGHPGVTVDRLAVADLPALARLETELFGAGAWSLASLADEISGEDRWYVAARDAAGEVVGYAGLWFDGEDAQVMTIGTATPHQGRGIGRLLLDRLVDRAHGLGAARVLLEVRVDNEPALRLYERAGFERLGRRRGYYQPENVDAWTMGLALDAAPAPDAPGARADGSGAEPVAADATRSAVLVTAGELAALLARDGDAHPVVLDVRWALGRSDGAEQHRAGHVPGAVYVDLETELAAPPTPQAGRHPLPDVAALQAAARRWGVRQGTPVVAYDAVGGMSAARAWWLLRWAGRTDVRLLDGGLDAWVAAGGALEQGDVVPEPGDVELSAGRLPTVDADEAAALARAGTLLDARAPERYRGEVEPVDPRAGHVPAALSAPTAGNLGPDGRFLPADALRERFAALGVGPGPGEVGVYCGSGVTAAHEVAALASIGVEARLYPGSWSQWSSDPDRPAATGPEPG
ncbi:hypothetical protein Q760_14215 [Cellulomonas cellasea DSM 20118]|uniref:Thiosulfate sulfurtransferase n=3 Tax=Cellulomonas cellasea TaxID=43670 RepID=A0A0A0B963_9CELL|nr:hypothetical protein Q760_14215 [Cellulomonas cellasea DSM 20118]GEA86261.1 hypothetical protein CCE01nite_02100 [Cellulomonas cellasea]